MKTRAVSMVLLMIASALAGCTSGDPDGDGELGIDTDVLNQMIEDNLQDFINNSSVTVHQTVHYHNNTTYVVDDGDYSTTNHAHFNNTTNVDGGEVVNNNYDQSENTWNVGGGGEGNGSSSNSIIQVVRMQNSMPFEAENIGDYIFIQDGVPVVGNVSTELWLIYSSDSTTISLTLTCSEYRNAYFYMESHNWEQWLHYEYGIENPHTWQIGEQIQSDIHQLYNQAEYYCSFNNLQSMTKMELLQMNISKGESIKLVGVTSSNWYWNISCVDGFYQEDSASGWYSYLGGWEDCQFTIYSRHWTYSDWDEVYTNSTNENLYSIPNWYDYSSYNQWAIYDTGSSFATHDSIIYFTKYFVVPVE